MNFIKDTILYLFEQLKFEDQKDIFDKINLIIVKKNKEELEYQEKKFEDMIGISWC